MMIYIQEPRIEELAPDLRTKKLHEEVGEPTAIFIFMEELDRWRTVKKKSSNCQK